MLTNKELWEKCGVKSTITCEDLGLPIWRNDTDGMVYECGGYTIYRTSKGYRHYTGKFVTKLQKWLYKLK